MIAPSADPPLGRPWFARLGGLVAGIGRLRGAPETLPEGRVLRCRFMAHARSRRVVNDARTGMHGPLTHEPKGSRRGADMPTEGWPARNERVKDEG
jgi:hypothetical protein